MAVKLTAKEEMETNWMYTPVPTLSKIITPVFLMNIVIIAAKYDLLRPQNTVFIPTLSTEDFFPLQIMVMNVKLLSLVINIGSQ